jgi:hypothetical protein
MSSACLTPLAACTDLAARICSVFIRLHAFTNTTREFLALPSATWLPLRMRHNFTYECSSAADVFTSMSGHNSSRSMTRNRHRPRPITTTGSRGPRSVKCLGIEAARPSRSSKYTRSSGRPSLLRNSSNSCPHRGWNGCTTRNRCNDW